MPANEDRLLVRIEAQSRQFEQQMRRVNQTLDRTTAQNRRMLAQMQRDTERASQRLWSGLGDGLRREVAALAPILAGAFSAQQVVAYADAWTSGRNALASAGVAVSDLAARQEALVDLANETRTSTDSTIALYSRLTMATRELGLSQDDTLRLTRLLNMSFASSGMSASEAASAALQLSQALASGTLQGDELRSLRENAPQIAQAIAEAMGVSVGALKELGAEGQITAQVVTSALFGAADEIESRFGATAVTVGQSLQILDNQLGRFIGQSDASVAASERMAQAIVALANNLDVVVTAAGVMVTILGTRMVVALAAAGVQTVRLTAFQVAMTASMTGTSRAALLATSAMTGLRTAMMFLLTNPFGIAITAVAVALALVATRTDEATTASADLERGNRALSDATDAYTQAAQAAAEANGDEAASAREAAAQARALAAERLRAARAALAQANATIALANAEARSRLDPSRERYNTRGDIPGRLSQDRDRQLAAQVRQATADAQASAAAIRAAQDAIASADRILELPAVSVDRPASAATGGGSGAGGGSHGPSAQELRDRRELFDLERDLELARAASNEREIARLEDEIAYRQLLAQMQELGIENAEAAAGQHIDALRQMATEEERLAELAAIRAKNDDLAAEARERELEAQRQIAEAEERRQSEIDDTAEGAARTMVQVLRSDNIWEEAGNRFRDAAWNGVEQLIAHLFRSMQGQGGSGNWITAALQMFGNSKFGGARASGGPVSAGQAYLVGEHRPEMFVPSTPGKIIPRVPQGGMIEHRVIVVPDRASFIDLAGEAAAPYAAAAYQGARRVIPQDMARKAARMKGRR